MINNSTEARALAHTSWSRTEDRTARTAPAREGLLRRFEREVDPEGRLPEAERLKRAESARRAHYSRLSLKGVAARKKTAGRRSDSPSSNA